jgi:hypothetical protein
LAGNLVKPLLSLYGTEWSERGYGLCCWLVSTIFGILVVAGLPSAIDAVMFLLPLLLLASLHAVAGFNVFESNLAFDGVHTVLAVLLLFSFLLLFAFLLL